MTFDLPSFAVHCGEPIRVEVPSLSPTGTASTQSEERRLARFVDDCEAPLGPELAKLADPWDFVQKSGFPSALRHQAQACRPISCQ
jgi:hypothetical protein